MILLLDENLSYKLCGSLADIISDVQHVKLVGLDKEDDQKIWEYAKTNNCTIVSKDNDFIELSIINGFPPKVVLLNAGNSNTNTIEKIIRRNCLKIKSFADDSENALLILKP